MTDNEMSFLEGIQHIQQCQGEDTYISDSFIRGITGLSKSSVTAGKKGLISLGIVWKKEVQDKKGTRYGINYKRLNAIIQSLNTISVASERWAKGREIRIERGLVSLKVNSLIEDLQWWESGRPDKVGNNEGAVSAADLFRAFGQK